MDKGIYCLLLRNPACTVAVGALGQRSFAAGFHVYVGSAQGSGGLQRVVRHVRLAKNRDRHPKWHIDYLLTDNHVDLVSVACAFTEQELECRLAEKFQGVPVHLFGCSDCACTSHLFYYPADPLDEIFSAFQTLGLVPAIKTLNILHAESNL
ncbi:MAG: GIY-YIG nuclease family protein [Methanoregula sp.]|nr:GIY-YIG nuclease family protein [Methanoregula sp.]